LSDAEGASEVVAIKDAHLGRTVRVRGRVIRRRPFYKESRYGHAKADRYDYIPTPYDREGYVGTGYVATIYDATGYVDLLLVPRARSRWRFRCRRGNVVQATGTLRMYMSRLIIEDPEVRRIRPYPLVPRRNKRRPREWVRLREWASTKRAMSAEAKAALAHPAEFLEWLQSSERANNPYSEVQSPLSEFVGSKLHTFVRVSGSHLIFHPGRTDHFPVRIPLSEWAVDVQQRLELIWPAPVGNFWLLDNDVVHEVATSTASDVLRRACARVLGPGGFYQFLRRRGYDRRIAAYLEDSLTKYSPYTGGGKPYVKATVASVTPAEIRITCGAMYGTFPPPRWVALYLELRPEDDRRVGEDPEPLQRDVLQVVSRLVEETLQIEPFATWLERQPEGPLGRPIETFILDSAGLWVDIDDDGWHLKGYGGGYMRSKESPFEGATPSWVSAFLSEPRGTREQALHALRGLQRG